MTLNTYFASLKYSSPTFLVSMVNTIASLTFIIAVVLRLVNTLPHMLILSSYSYLYLLIKNYCYPRLEAVDLRKLHGVAKVVGTLVSLAGVTVMTLYKGQALRNLGHPLIHIQGKASSARRDWLKGSVLTVSSCITWSMFYIMQVPSYYPKLQFI